MSSRLYRSSFLFRKIRNKLKLKMSDSRILILNADFKMSLDKFMQMMWSDNAFWHKVQSEQGLFDLEFGKFRIKF